MTTEASAFVPLQYFLKAKSKQLVNLTVEERNGPILEEQKKKISTDLGIKIEEAEQLVVSVRNLIKLYLYQAGTQPQALFPAGFHTALRDLLCQILQHHAKDWRQAAISSQVSLPRLLDIDWRIDIKSASEQMSKMHVPTVLVQLKVEDGPGKEKIVTFELSNETLQAMLEGLGKIRDQLNAVKGQ